LLANEYQFIAERLNNDTWTAVTKEFNREFGASLSVNALQKRYNREVTKLEVLGDDSVEKAFKLIKANPIKPTELAKRFNLDMDGLEDLMDDLLNRRAAIQFKAGYLVFDRTAPVPDNIVHQIELFKDEGWVKWGLIADPHICSAHEQIELLHGFYRICEEEQVKGVICAGDFTAGNGTVYKGQYQDLKIVGEDKQIEYVCSVYPQTSLKTYTISGNHDLDLYKQCGSDIVAKIAERREDIEYLGKMSATMEHEGVRFFVHHGEGGLGMVRSYKPQRILDHQKVEDICDVSVIGHWHISLHIPKYRNSIIVLPMCFEAQSDYLIKKSLNPDIGGVILHLKIADVDGVKKVVRHRADFLDMGTILGA
jgi:predicted phosphodiesterase